MRNGLILLAIFALTACGPATSKPDAVFNCNPHLNVEACSYDEYSQNLECVVSLNDSLPGQTFSFRSIRMMEYNNGVVVRDRGVHGGGGSINKGQRKTFANTTTGEPGSTIYLCSVDPLNSLLGDMSDRLVEVPVSYK